jgi:hypothetical protein
MRVRSAGENLGYFAVQTKDYLGGTMRNLTLLTTVVLSSTMLAATAAAQTQSQSPQCSPFGQRLGLCETIGVSASAAVAAGGALNLLRKDYLIVPIEQTAGSMFPSHLVIGAADLEDAQIIALLKRSYRVGKTIAIVGATADQASRFHRLLWPGQQASCKLPTGQTISSLYGLQRSRYRFPPQNSSYCLVNLDLQHPAADRRWLRDRFGLTPPQPAAGTGNANGKLTAKVAATDNPTDFLTDLASATHCSAKGSSNPNNGTMESDLYVYAMRNFTDTGCSSCQDEGADYYLVQNNLSYSKNSSSVTSFEVDGPPPLMNFGSAGLVPFTTGSFNLEFTDPATTTTVESSYTNSSSVTLSASIGFDSDGPDVTVGGSVTTSQQMTYNVPATTIANRSNLAKAEPTWTFTPQSLPLGTDFEVNPTWTWFIPRDAYPSGPLPPGEGGIGNGGIVFYNYAYLFSSNANLGDLDQDCWVNIPFSAWSVNPPVLQSLGSGSTTIDGGVFTITGVDLYPSSVVAVLIGGTPVPLSTNVDLVDAVTIDVTVPGGYAPGTYQVQVNTQFNGQTRFSNTLPLTLTN